MLTAHVVLGSLVGALICATSGLGEDIWKVTNRGPQPYVVRLRPASNRKVGFAIAEKVGSGETKVIALTYPGSFDINIQFMGGDGVVRNSWTSDVPVDLRRRTTPAAGDNLMELGMVMMEMGADGKPRTYPVKALNVAGTGLLPVGKKLIDLKAMTIENPRIEFGGRVALEGETVEYRVSGPPEDLALNLSGRVYKLGELSIVRNFQEGSVVVSGTYAGVGGAGEFLLDRRDSFPFDRLMFDVRERGASEWRAFGLGAPRQVASRVESGSGLRIDDVRDVVSELGRGLRADQMRVEQRLEAMDAKLDERLTDLELRLADPPIHRILSSCVGCHRTDPGRGPKGYHTLRTSLPKMSAETSEKMMRLSELKPEERARFLEFVEGSR